MAMRSHDNQAFALCTRCHRCFHDGSYEFRPWVKQERRDWQEEAVVRTRARYLSQKDPEGSPPGPDTGAST